MLKAWIYTGYTAFYVSIVSLFLQITFSDFAVPQLSFQANSLGYIERKKNN